MAFDHFWRTVLFLTSAPAADLITFFIMFDTMCISLFVSLVFLMFWYPMKKCPPAMLRALIYDN